MVSRIASFFIIVGFIISLWSWSRLPVEVPLIEITAAHDVPALGLPIYAQFIVTQSLKFSRPASVSTLTLPAYIPNDQPNILVVDILSEGKLRQRWRISGQGNSPAAAELHHLRLMPPQTMQGNIEVRMSSVIDSDHKDVAPRVFTETANQNYAAGNYRIAANEKLGDISLTLWETKSRNQIVREFWDKQPLQAIVQVGQLGLALILASVLPGIILSLFKLNQARQPHN